MQKFLLRLFICLFQFMQISKTFTMFSLKRLLLNIIEIAKQEVNKANEDLAVYLEMKTSSVKEKSGFRSFYYVGGRKKRPPAICFKRHR